MNGYVAGAAAGSWLIDGNTSEETAVTWIRSQTGGDDTILMNLPDSPLSGEWADAPTPASVLAEVDIELEDVQDELTELLDAWERGFQQGALEEVLHSATTMLGLRFTRRDDPHVGDAARIAARSKEFATEEGFTEEGDPPAADPTPHGWDIVDVDDAGEPVGQSFGVTAREALMRFAMDVGMEGRVVISDERVPKRGPSGELESTVEARLTACPWIEGEDRSGYGPMMVLEARPRVEGPADVTVWYTVPVGVTVDVAAEKVTRVVVIDEEVGLVGAEEVGTRPCLTAQGAGHERDPVGRVPRLGEGRASFMIDVLAPGIVMVGDDQRQALDDPQVYFTRLGESVTVGVGSSITDSVGVNVSLGDLRSALTEVAGIESAVLDRADIDDIVSALDFAATEKHHEAAKGDFASDEERAAMLDEARRLSLLFERLVKAVSEADRGGDVPVGDVPVEVAGLTVLDQLLAGTYVPPEAQ